MSTKNREDLKTFISAVLAASEERITSGLRAEMRDGFAAIRKEMMTMATKEELAAGLAAVRGEMASGFAAVRQEMATKDKMAEGFTALRSEMMNGFEGVGDAISEINDRREKRDIEVDKRLVRLDRRVFGT